MSLLLCLQFCPIDQEEARELVRLLVDIEPNHRTDVEFWLSIRDDVEPDLANSLASQLRQKFQHVKVHRCLRRGRGHPHGCNEMWFDLMQAVFMAHREGFTKCTGVLTFEADCVPLRRDWIDVLISEWNKAQGMGKFVMGHLQKMPAQPGHEASEHINGNAVFGVEMHGKYPKYMYGCGADSAWDLELAKLTVPNSYDTHAIMQVYRMKGVTAEFMEAVKKHGEKPALFHGVKGTSAIKIQREALLGK